MENKIELKLCRKKLHWYPVKQKRCVECHKKIKAEWRKTNKNKTKEYQKQYYINNKETLCDINKTWKKANTEQHRNTCKKWHIKNPEKSRALYAKQRANKKQAVAAWGNQEKITWFYKEAARLTKETGVKYHVDHIYPLQSKYLCGLHVENNLQILTAQENISKSNRYWPGQLDCQKE